MEILNVTNCLNKRRMRKNRKQKEIANFKKAEAAYLKSLFGRLCYEMMIDKYFDDDERVVFISPVILPRIKPVKSFRIPVR